MNPTNLSFSPSYNSTLTLMKLFLLPSASISMHQQEDPANPSIKQLYIDGHFCYACKFGIVTNNLGIVRSISFYNKEFFDKHPEIVVNKKSDFPDEDKSVHDARLLIPALQDLFAATFIF